MNKNFSGVFISGGGKKESVNIGGDNDSPIKTNQGNIEIGGDNKSSIETNQGNIKISGSNSSSIETNQGDIKILGSNSSTIETNQGDIEVGKFNSGFIETNQGNVKLTQNKSTGVVESNKGSIVVEQNDGRISLMEGNIKVNENFGELKIYSGKILVGGFEINVQRESKINGINVITSGNVISVISGGGSIYINNGKVYIDGVEQNPSSSSNKGGYIVKIGDYEIDYNKKTLKDLSGNTYDIKDVEFFPVTLVGNEIYLTYKNQSIVIGDEDVLVEGKN